MNLEMGTNNKQIKSNNDNDIEELSNGISYLMKNESESDKNKGTGAGGYNTNKYGLSFEKKTELNTEYDIINIITYGKEIKFKQDKERTFIKIHKLELFKYMNLSIDKKYIPHGCKQPDECYIDEKYKRIFILEKKFQSGSGSVCEKIQTADFKRQYFQKIFEKYKIIYIYCLSYWFIQNCIPELKFLDDIKIPVFFTNNKNYKNDIIKFMLNCK